MKTILLSLLLASPVAAQNIIAFQNLHATGGGAEGQVRVESLFHGTDFSVLGGWDADQTNFSGILTGPELDGIDVTDWFTNPAPQTMFTLSSASITISTPFWGNIIAPNAHVKLTADVHGSIAAKNVTVTDAWVRHNPYCVPEPKGAMLAIAAAFLGIFIRRR